MEAGGCGVDPRFGFGLGCGGGVFGLHVCLWAHLRSHDPREPPCDAPKCAQMRMPCTKRDAHASAMPPVEPGDAYFATNQNARCTAPTYAMRLLGAEPTHSPSRQIFNFFSHAPSTRHVSSLRGNHASHLRSHFYAEAKGQERRPSFETLSSGWASFYSETSHVLSA